MCRLTYSGGRATCWQRSITCILRRDGFDCAAIILSGTRIILLIRCERTPPGLGSPLANALEQLSFYAQLHLVASMTDPIEPSSERPKFVHDDLAQLANKKAQEPYDEITGWRLALIFFGLSVLLLLAFMDETIVATALVVISMSIAIPPT